MSPGSRLIAGLAVAAALVGYASYSPFLAAGGRGVTLSSGSGCHPSYAGRCLPLMKDVDCFGENGRPPFTGRVTVVGPDVYNLDADGDGIGCE